MIISCSMVEAFIHSFLKKDTYGDFEVVFQHDDFMNAEAQKISEAYRVQNYEGCSRYDLLMEGVRIFKNLQSQGIIIDLDQLGEQAWLMKYLPILSSEIFTSMMAVYQTQYNYADLDEICRQTVTALMLASHSSPTLFQKKPQEFEVLAHRWSIALLTFNCCEVPLFEFTFEAWHERRYYSTDRNLMFFDLFAKMKLDTIGVPSNSEDDQVRRQKWLVLDAIRNMIPDVVRDHDLMDSHVLLDAIKTLQLLEQHAHELPSIQVLANEDEQVKQASFDLSSLATNLPSVDVASAQQAVSASEMPWLQHNFQNLFLSTDRKGSPVAEGLDEDMVTEAGSDADDEAEKGMCYLG